METQRLTTSILFLIHFLVSIALLCKIPNNKQITNDYNGPRPENLRLQPEKLPYTPPRIVPEMPDLQSGTVLKKPQMESSILSAG